ncbi:hypothetical protein LTR86_000988 [Recurvomyces mirabilis]|nr:hypothetical protein LTR86_000988 [Recurvomyces mirabilis]
MATEAAMTDMDIDIDYGMDEDTARMLAEAEAMQATNGIGTEEMNGVEEAAEEGEVEQNALVPKVHVRGVDDLSTRDVENFASEHFSDDLFKKVEWVNDSAVNLIYDTDAAAAEALTALSAEERSDPLEERAAKRLTTHPDVVLVVRRAVESDVKVKNASLHSRYYLDNAIDPEDPHGNRSGKRRYGERGYRNRDYGNKRRRRDTEDDGYARRGSGGDAFDENMYDDNPASVEARTEGSQSYTSADVGRKRARTGDELFPDKASGRLRNRSASPERDGDGRYGFDDNQPQRQPARPRSRTPPRRARDNREARELMTKELFPDKKPTIGMNGHGGAAMDLFPTHSSPPKTPRELFPSHKRQEARDIDNEYRRVETDLGRYSFDGIDERDTYSISDKGPRRQEKGDLFSRISGGPVIDKSYGRLDDRSDSDFSFKGAGRKDNGYSILGASGETKKQSSLPKELFPLKAGHGASGKDLFAGKDLFDGKIKGRGSRRRAEDFA